MDASRTAKADDPRILGRSRKNSFKDRSVDKEMMVDEMTDFFYQTMMSMADTYDRATKNKEMVGDLETIRAEFL